jgi:WD40 repeat protein
MPEGRANPYVGPTAFREGQTLYGRDREAEDVTDLLIAERVVLLYSPSGAGKTSLVEAKLIPRLRKEQFTVLPVMRVSQVTHEELRALPGANRYVLSALRCLEARPPAGQPALSLAELAGLKFGEYLKRHPPGENDQPLVLIFDQFEEILTADPADQEAKQAFFEQVGAALRNRGRWALFAMREDYVAGLDRYLPLVPTRLSNTFRLDLLDRDAARAAIQEPARVAGIPFNPETAGKLVDDLRTIRVQGLNGAELVQGPYVEPVQLQVVCWRLWENLPAGLREIGDGERNLGDVDNALGEYYDNRVQTIAAARPRPPDAEREIRNWFGRQLITAQGIRGQVLKGDVNQKLADEVIAALVNAHLVREDKRHGATWFELAHDRLIEPVTRRNNAWAEEHLSPLQRLAGVWDMKGRPEGLLLRHEQLQEAERWAREAGDALTATDRDFLQASQDYRARSEERRKLQKYRRYLWLIPLALLAAAAAIGLMVWAWRAEKKARALAEQTEKQRQQLDRQVTVLNAQQLIADALAARQANPERGFQEAKQALRTLRDLLPVLRPENKEQALLCEQAQAAQFQAQMALSLALQESRVLRSLEQPRQPVSALARHPLERTRLAAAYEDGTVALWDVSPTPARRLWDRPGGVGKPTALAFSPDGAKLAVSGEAGLVRIWDGLPGGARELLTLRGHGGSVNAVAFSPDGAFLAAAGADGAVRVWDVARGLEWIRLQAHEGQARAVAFDPAPRHRYQLATAGDDRKAKLWDLRMAFVGDRVSEFLAPARVSDALVLPALLSARARAPVRTLSGHFGAVNAVAFQASGDRLATVSDDKTWALWDMATGRRLRYMTAQDVPARCLAFSPDGKRLATAGRSTDIRVWDADTGRLLMTLAGHTDNITGLAFFPRGELLASASTDKTLKVWDISSRRKFLTRLPNFAQVRSLAVAPNGRQVALAPVNQPGVVIDASSARTLFMLSGRLGPLWGSAISPDGRWLAAAGEDGTVRLWEITARNARLVYTLQGGPASARNPIYTVAFRRDSKWLATAGRDGRLTIWEVATGQPLKNWLGHNAAIWGVAFDPTGKRLATVSEDRTAKVWDLSHVGVPSVAGPPDALFTLDGYAERLWGVAFSPNGQLLATVGGDGNGEQQTPEQRAVIWDITVTPPRKFSELAGHANSVNGVAFSPDETRIATASLDGHIMVWPVRQGKPKPLYTLGNGKAAFFAVAFGPNGKRLAGGCIDETARVWDLSADVPSEVHVLREENGSGWVWSLAFTRDGKRLVTCRHSGKVGVWEVTKPRPLKLFSLPPGHAGFVYQAVFSPDGKRLASAGDDGRVKIWDVDSHRELSSLETQTVKAMAFDRAGKYLATAGLDGTVTIWGNPTDAEIVQQTTTTFAELTAFPAHTGPVRAMAFDTKGDRLATVGDDRTAKVWDLTRKIWDLKRKGRDLKRWRPTPLEPGLYGRHGDSHAGIILAVEFSPDGRLLATGGTDKSVRVWDLSAPKGKRMAFFLQGPASEVNCLAFSPDGKSLYAGGLDKIIRVWDISSPSPETQVKDPAFAWAAHAGRVVSVVFDDETGGKRFVSAGLDGTVRTFLLDPDELLRVVESYDKRKLDD